MIIMVVTNKPNNNEDGELTLLTLYLSSECKAFHNMDSSCFF